MSHNRNKLLRRIVRSVAWSVAMTALILTASGGAINAEEIVIGENSGETVAGDFRCKPCYRPIINHTDAFQMNGPSLTTGDLYRYFQSRGITNIDRLSLQVDIDCCPEEDRAFQLDDLDFRITGTDNTILAQASLHNDSLLVAGAEISSFKPEAVLEIDLGYNFMERFSSESTDAIQLNYSSPAVEGQMPPRFVVSEDISSFTSSNVVFLILFVGFWLVVFLMMNLLAKPKNESMPPKSGNLVGS